MDRDLEEIIHKAREAEACREGLRWIEAWETLEEAFNHPKAAAWAVWYAMYVIKGRWPEAEGVIAKDPRKSYYYAMYVIKGRWPEGEWVIAKDPYHAYYYAKDVIKGRWPEGEPAIASNRHIAHWYVKEFGQMIMPDGNSSDKGAHAVEAKRSWISPTHNEFSAAFKGFQSREKEGDQPHDHEPVAD